MTITIPSGRTLPLQAKSGGGFASLGAATGSDVDVAEPTAEYFSDGFESGDFSKQRPGGGNFWVANQFGSIVTMNENGDPVYNGTVIPDDPRDWTAKEGDFSLRVRYPAGSNANAVQHWKIQESDAMPDAWVAFWLRVPVNFRKRGTNNKLFWMWMDGRSNDGVGSTVGMEFRGTDSATWYCKVGAGDNQVVGGDQGSTLWIAYPDDQGRWMRIVINAKAESAPGASDGIMRVWRRWANEGEFTNTHNLTGQPIKLPDDPASPQGFCECEILGYPNGSYAEDTEFLIDDLRISPTPLVPSGTEGL